MNFKRLTSTSDPFFTEAMELFTTSFPLFEQRTENSQARALSDPDYYAYVALEDDQFVGIIFCWEPKEFNYVEHFAISKTLRGHGYGTKILNAYGADKELVFLGIDPPIDDVSKKRLHFYENQGFKLHPYICIHPAERLGEPRTYPLHLMSKDGTLTEEQFEFFQTFIAERIMIYSEANDQ